MSIERSPRPVSEPYFLGEINPSLVMSAAYQAHILELQGYLSNDTSLQGVERDEIKIKLAQAKAEYIEWLHQISPNPPNNSDTLNE